MDIINETEGNSDGSFRNSNRYKALEIPCKMTLTPDCAKREHAYREVFRFRWTTVRVMRCHVARDYVAISMTSRGHSACKTSENERISLTGANLERS